MSLTPILPPPTCLHGFLLLWKSPVLITEPYDLHLCSAAPALLHISHSFTLGCGTVDSGAVPPQGLCGCCFSSTLRHSLPIAPLQFLPVNSYAIFNSQLRHCFPQKSFLMAQLYIPSCNAHVLLKLHIVYVIFSPLSVCSLSCCEFHENRHQVCFAHHPSPAHGKRVDTPDITAT